MNRTLLLSFVLAMPIFAEEQPPRILEVYRDLLKPGSDAAYRKIEEDAARICIQLKCPHPYLGIESLTGPKEAWWLNGYESPAEQTQVAEAYAQNFPLMAALNQIVRRKRGLIGEPVEVFANYRQDLSRSKVWSVGRGRFLVITMTKSDRKIDGTVFETADGTRFIVTPARTREEADRTAAAAGPETDIFAVRPYWSMPAKEWMAADQEFWHPARTVKAE